MDFEAYRKAFYADPAPEPRFRVRGSMEVSLFFEDYEAAVDYYQSVLGPPGYVEGTGTRGWHLGPGWLTLLRGESGNPRNVELTLQAATPDEAERLQRAFIDAGGQGPAPTDELMYVPVRSCPVRDPFGTHLLIICPLDSG
jgi:hypothetical protein